MKAIQPIRSQAVCRNVLAFSLLCLLIFTGIPAQNGSGCASFRMTGGDEAKKPSILFFLLIYYVIIILKCTINIQFPACVA